MRGLADASLMLGAAILGVAALWHFYWAVGGRAGLRLAIPERSGKPLLRPSRPAIVAAGLVIGAVGVVYGLAAASRLEGLLPATVVAALLGLFGTVFVLRGIGDFRHVGVFNRGTDNGFARADRLYYSPLCLFLGAAGLAAAAARLS